MTIKEEKILIRKCIAGNSKAQKKLYDTFAYDMFKVCRSYALDYDTANDYLQEGFMKVFQNLHKYEATGNLGGWMRRLMINNCVDAIRKDFWSKHKVSFEEYLTHDEFVTENTSMKSVNTDSFFEVLNELPPGYKMVLNLYYIEEYKHTEIAETLGISVGTSKSQLHKAKSYLKDILLRNMTLEEIEIYVGQLAKEVV